MDPLTISGGSGGYGVLLVLLILWSLAIWAKARNADISDVPENG